MNKLYFSYSDYLKKKYGRKVYKIPVHMPLGCPNRDGSKGLGGCTFCSEKGTAFETETKNRSIAEQVSALTGKIGKRYGADAFIIYFQNYTNTYLPLSDFRKMLVESVCDDRIVEVCISTRPDCIDTGYMEAMSAFRESSGLEVSLEFGLQTTNEETLKKINRGHDVEAYVRAMELAREFRIPVTTHLILNFPWDTTDDVEDMARLMNRCGSEVVKLHSLYIAKGTVMADQFEAREFDMITMDAYVARVARFLALLEARIAVARLVSRIPAQDSVFSNWGRSWWVIQDAIIEYMRERQWVQGCLVGGGRNVEEYE